LDELDRQLFRQAMRGVRRLHVDAPRAGAARPRPRPLARFSRAERAAVLEESISAPSPFDPVAESGDALLFHRPAVSDTVFRQLRRGHYRVDGEIDLHGLTAAMVVPALRSFLADALHHDARVVRVIHGKGLRSGNRGPVLKQVASDYLRRVGAVLAFASAREVDGGSGAILVLLARKSRPGRR
jgi:DNA-nicking Smr family endonuclease